MYFESEIYEQTLASNNDYIYKNFDQNINDAYFCFMAPENVPKFKLVF